MTLAFKPEPRDREPSRALIAASNGDGVILWFDGPDIDSVIRETGTARLDDVGLDDAPDGISVWEGRGHAWETHTPDAHEYDFELLGAFRAPSDDEWAALRKGECPWSCGSAIVKAQGGGGA